MFSSINQIAKNIGIDTLALYQSISRKSLDAAIKEQDLTLLVDKLRHIVPDLQDQYSIGFDPIEYENFWELKMRGQQAWQVRLMLKAIKHINVKEMILADIGDSSGNHGRYIKILAPEGTVKKVISINLDPVAVEKVRARGEEAILSRAEELDLEGIKPDLFLSFEMLEHLTDPIRFLHSLATKGNTEYLLMTVPYVRTSRFGGAIMRRPIDQMQEKMTAEEVHFFELSPEDWLLAAQFSGYQPVFTNIYLQYPRHSLFRIMKPLWQKLDFEGFFGVLLKRDLTVAERYTDW